MCCVLHHALCLSPPCHTPFIALSLIKSDLWNGRQKIVGVSDAIRRGVGRVGKMIKETVEEGRAVIMEQEVLLWLVAVELVAELLVLLLC